MSEGTQPQNGPNPSDDLHRSISYLFENMRDMKQDIRDVRQDIKEVHGRIDGVKETIEGVKDTLLQRPDTRFTLTITTMVALAAVIITAIKMDF